MAENDPSFGIASATLIDSKRSEGLTVCPVTYVELAPVFNGDAKALDEFLLKLGANWPETWTFADTTAAHEAWHRYVMAKRSGKVPKRPVADILIGAFASRFDGLLSRNPADFRPNFPKFSLVVPYRRAVPVRTRPGQTGGRDDFPQARSAVADCFVQGVSSRHE